MFAKYYFSLLILHNILPNFLLERFYHFNFLTVLGGCIIRVTNYYYGKYFSISILVKSGGSCDAKVKLIYYKKRKGINVEL